MRVTVMVVWPLARPLTSMWREGGSLPSMALGRLVTSQPHFSADTSMTSWPERALGVHHGLHRDLLDAGAGIGIGRPCPAWPLRCRQQAGGDHQCAAHDHRRRRDDVAHGLQFLLARLAAGGQVVDGAADVLQGEAHVLAGGDVVLSLM